MTKLSAQDDFWCVEILSVCFIQIQINRLYPRTKARKLTLGKTLTKSLLVRSILGTRPSIYRILNGTKEGEEKRSIRPSHSFQPQKLLEAKIRVESTETAVLGATVREVEVVMHGHQVDVNGSAYCVSFFVH